MEMCICVGSWKGHIYSSRGELRKRDVCSYTWKNRAALSYLQSSLSRKVYKEKGEKKGENSACLREDRNVCMCEDNGGKMWRIIDTECIGSNNCINARSSKDVRLRNLDGGMIS